ncbi:MAG: arylamine N-acetyltransferase [Microcoleaceae cyanobacterium]
MRDFTEDFVTQYLRRIDYQGSIKPTIETLRQLQIAHLYAVPFENISIHLQQPIQLNYSWLFTKIIEQNRGGFCYELNGLFSLLLNKLGFEVTLLSAEVAKEDGTYGRELGHLTLLISGIDNWLVDVGFGESFIYPLKLENGIEINQRKQTYKLINQSDIWTLYQDKEGWKPQYRFQLVSRKLEEFNPVCGYNQTNSQSIFKQRLICTRLTPEGRVTLSDHKLIITQNEQRYEKMIEDTTEYKQVLKNNFNIDLNLYSERNITYLLDFVFLK